MKKLIAVAIVLASTPAFAHPGGHSLVCKSAKKSGAKQVIDFTLNRSNGTGWYPPSFSVTVDGKKHDFTTDDEMKSFGRTFHDAPLGVIVITADNGEDANAATHGSFTLEAIPSTVKAYDHDGKRVRWSLEAAAADDACYDSNGKARFRAVFRGAMSGDGVGTDESQLGPQILDCELDYDSGMSC